MSEETTRANFRGAGAEGYGRFPKFAAIAIVAFIFCACSNTSRCGPREFECGVHHAICVVGGNHYRWSSSGHKNETMEGGSGWD